MEEDFQDAFFGGAGEGGGSFREGEAAVDHGFDIELAVLQEFEGGGEAAAAGAEEGDFGDDDGGHVEGYLIMNGGLHDDGAAGAAHGDGGGEAFGGAGGVDDVVETGEGRLGAGEGAAAFDDGEFFRVAPEVVDGEAMGEQDLADEQAEFAVAEDGDLGAFRDAELLEDFAGGGDGFGEDGDVIGEGPGDFEEVFHREGEEFGEGAGMFDDAEYGAAGAVAAETAAAPGAAAAGEVDLTDDTFADPLGGSLFHDADELVAGDAGEAVVAGEEFEIGITDAGGGHTDESAAAGDGGLADGDGAGFDVGGDHSLPALRRRLQYHQLRWSKGSSGSRA